MTGTSDLSASSAPLPSAPPNSEAADFEQYHAYLRSRSKIGGLYRRRFLYPRIARELTGRVLDIGCGIGDMLKFRPNTVGLDINPLNVAACCAEGLDARVMQPDVLPVESASFNGAILDNVLEHIADPRPLLAEVHRVVAPGGTLLCGVPGRRGYASDPDHKVFYDETGLTQLLAGAGFSAKRLFHAPFGLPALDNVMRQYCLYGSFVRQ